MDTELLEECRVLADSVFTRVEPIIAGFAEGLQRAGRTSTPSDEPSSFDGCSRCPVCALAAAIRGERHELLIVLAEHAVTLPALLRELLDEFLGGLDNGRRSESDDNPDGARPAPDGSVAYAARNSDGVSGRPRPSAFVPIDVTVRR
ncbi:hypothetical protein J7E69_31250 [Rhodococcus enclensis]|nr:hypothetical protein [Rhodococcus qingshengii]